MLGIKLCVRHDRECFLVPNLITRMKQKGRDSGRRDAAQCNAIHASKRAIHPRDREDTPSMATCRSKARQLPVDGEGADPVRRWLTRGGRI